MTVQKSPQLKLLQGNPGNRPVPGKSKSTTGRPLPPPNLKGEAFAEWARVTDYLSKVGRIEQIDYAGLVVYCSSWAMYVDAVKAVEEYGPLVAGRDGLMVKNPAAQIMRDASDTMLKFGAKFGTTPRDRLNLGIATELDDADDMDKALQAL